MSEIIGGMYVCMYVCMNVCMNVCMYVHTSTTSVPVHVLLYVCTYVHTYTQLGDNCHLYQAARNCSNNKAARVPDNGRYVQPVWCTFPFTPLCCITVISTINDSCILRKSSRVSLTIRAMKSTHLN